MGGVEEDGAPGGGLLKVVAVRSLRRPRLPLWAGICFVAAAALGGSQGDISAAPLSERQFNERVTVDVRGPRGHGRVVSVPPGINCAERCTRDFLDGTKVVLVAGHELTSSFVGWKGDCFGRSVWCVLVADRDIQVTATFSAKPTRGVGHIGVRRPWLYVTASRPTGGGPIRSKPEGIRCPGRCEARFPRGMPVRLRANARAGYAAEWVSDPLAVCRARMDTCTVSMRQTTHVGVTFRRR